MSRQCWKTLAFSAIAAVCAGAILAVYRDRWWGRPFDGAAPETPTLSLPAAPPQGRWGDPKEGAQWEEKRRQIGIELSSHKENGSIRCSLRVRPGAAAWKEPELEVELRNTSDKPATIRIHRTLLDAVTFVLRDPEDKVVSSFCYVTVHSTFETLPPITLRPGEAKLSQMFLSVAADHGFQPLRPGVYSLEAVFHENSFFDPLGQVEGMLARSDRIPVRVE
jgi:hypothetical protein